jgi:hypothetical protein
MMILTGRAKNAYEWFKQREQELLKSADDNDGKLAAHDWWRVAYYRQPYLLLESNNAIIERFIDVFSNSIDITADGKISPTPMIENDLRLSKLFTELIEETNWRGIMTQDSIAMATEQINSYFLDGEPVGVKMFKNKTKTMQGRLLKFSKKEFITDIYKYGRLKISPASYYAKGSHIRAVKDLETTRKYKLKAINEAIYGKDSVVFQGKLIPIINGVVRVQVVLNDYYLFSTCKEINRRMPTDFDADATLIIKDKPAFLHRLRKAFALKFPNWDFLEGEVYYFDPYNDIPKDTNQEFSKHLSYAYQKEHRCVLKPRNEKNDALQPFFIELGPLDDISEVIFTA